MHSDSNLSLENRQSDSNPIRKQQHTVAGFHWQKKEPVTYWSYHGHRRKSTW